MAANTIHLQHGLFCRPTINKNVHSIGLRSQQKGLYKFINIENKLLDGKGFTKYLNNLNNNKYYPTKDETLKILKNIVHIYYEWHNISLKDAYA